MLKKREGAEQDRRERDRMARKKYDQRILIIHLQSLRLGCRVEGQGEASSNNSTTYFKN